MTTDVYTKNSNIFTCRMLYKNIKDFLLVINYIYEADNQVEFKVTYVYT